MSRTGVNIEMQKSTTRLLRSNPQLDAAEQDWWNTFADVEDEFCWVQTPNFQKIIRADFLASIRELVKPGQKVVEVGCGTGWLLVLLAQQGMRNLVGIDFSKEQIRRALLRAAEGGVTDSIEFVVGTIATLRERADRFDLVIMHAFLHHLSIVEIRSLIEEIRSVIAPDGHLILLEPVANRNEQPNLATRILMRVLRRLVWLAASQTIRSKLWEQNSAEVCAREKINRRFQSQSPPPCGPSPKESPFLDGEISALLSPEFRVAEDSRCMSMSLWVAQQAILAGKSQKFWPKWIGYPLVRVSRLLERLLHAQKVTPRNLWVFHTYVCKPNPQ